MMPALLRPLIAWHDKARAGQLATAIVGGTPIEAFVPSAPTCPDCGLASRDADLVYVHMMETHRDRRHAERRHHDVA